MSRRSQLQNPFVGLRPFESEDSLYYFGRGEQIKVLLRQLHQTRFLAVVGSSGCGKSSLVRAGLIPNLEAGFLVQDRDLWHIATMKPGDAPLPNLARELLSVLGESTETKALETFTETIRRSGAQAVLKKILPVLDTQDTNLLLMVDQFEELYRFQREGDSWQEEAAEFVSILLRLVEQSEAPIFICLTMRADFLGDCDAFQGLPEAVNRSQYLVPRLTRQQRREAIAGPIRLAGAKIAPRLLDRLLNENVGTRDDLPILQHALMRTWAQWAGDDHGPIDMVHYDKIHTVKNALNDHADEALNELNEGDRVIAQRLFQTLTETDSGNRRVRRPAHLSEMAAISDSTPQKVLEVIGKFREADRNFLVLSSENPADDPLVDISHESFIRQWQTLSRWVDEEAESAKIYRRLAETAELHAAGRADFYHEANYNLAKVFEQKAHQALKDARGDNDVGDYKQVWLHTAAALKQEIGPGRMALSMKSANALLAPETIKKAFAERWFSPSVTFHSGAVLSMAFSPDGKTLASGSGDIIGYNSSDNTIQLWDVATGNSLRELQGHANSISSVAFSPDGKNLASVSNDNTIRLWDVPFYFMFWKDGKTTALLHVFAEGVEFYWQVGREELEFKRQVKPNLYPQDGYHFKYNPKFRPLLKPPAPGQSKFDQILEWAKVQLEKGK